MRYPRSPITTALQRRLPRSLGSFVLVAASMLLLGAPLSTRALEAAEAHPAAGDVQGRASGSEASEQTTDSANQGRKKAARRPGDHDRRYPPRPSRDEAGGTFIPEGQEQTIGRILDVDEEASGGYTFAGGEIRWNRIDARYRHQETERVVAVELGHPSAAPRRAPSSDKLALLSGEAPEQLLDALFASARREEEDLRWYRPEAEQRRGGILGFLSNDDRRGYEPDWLFGSPGSWFLWGIIVALGLSVVRRLFVRPKGADFGGEKGKSREGFVSGWKRSDTALLLLLALFALVPRLIHLDSRPVETDEAGVMGELPNLVDWASMCSFARFKPPVHPQVCRLATRHNSDMLAARMVSVVAGFVTVMLVFLVVRARAGREAAFLAGLILALASGPVFMSQVARSYALLGMTLVLAHMALQRAVARGGGAWDVYTLAAALALMTDYLALGPIVAEALMVMAAPGLSLAIRRSAVLALGGALALTSFAIAITGPYLVTGSGFSPERLQPSGPSEALSIIGGEIGGAWPVLGVLLLSAGIGIGAFRGRRQGRPQLALWCLLASFAGVLAISIAGSFVQEVRARYVIHALTLLVLALGTAMAFLPALPRRMIVAALIVSHGFLMADRFVLGCTRHKTCDEPRLLEIVSEIQRATAEEEIDALVVFPTGRLHDVLYRVHRLHHHKHSAVHNESFSLEGEVTTCPVMHCIPTHTSPVYGITPNCRIEPLMELHPRLMLLVRDDGQHLVPAACLATREYRSYTLFVCED